MAQLTRTAPPEETVEVRPPAREVDLRRAVTWGIYSGISLVFVAVIGMVQTFAARPVINPWLTVGYLLVFVIPLVYGYVAGRPPEQLQGFAAPTRSSRNVAAGAIAGAVTAAVLVLFMALVTLVDVRRILINVSPRLLDTLQFGRGLAVGSLIQLGVLTFLGTVGGAIHLLPQTWRRPLVAAGLWVITIGMLRDFFAQVFRGIRLSDVNQVLFAGRGGLRPLGAAIVFVAFVALYLALERRRTSVRERFESLDRTDRIRYSAIGIVILLAFLAVLPQILGVFMSEVLDLVGIFLLMGLGLNIVVGFAGLLDLGYVAFFAVGAYTGAVFISPDSPRWTLELTFWLALPFVMLAAAFSGVIVGTPVLRMRGDYLAIVTLGFGEIARILFLSDWLAPFFGGAQGITRIPTVSVGPFALRTAPQFFYIIAFFVLVAAYVSWALQESRIGRAWMAMREDEPIAEALGINIVTAKLSAFIVGAVLASFGGALFATRIGSIFPHSFNIIVSIIVLVIIIVGGMGSIPGVAVGALVLVGVPQILREFEEFQFLLYGALLIFMMINKPEGLVPSRRRVQELHQEDMMQDAWLTKEQREQEKARPATSPEADPDAGLA